MSRGASLYFAVSGRVLMCLAVFRRVSPYLAVFRCVSLCLADSLCFAASRCVSLCFAASCWASLRLAVSRLWKGHISSFSPLAARHDFPLSLRLSKGLVKDCAWQVKVIVRQPSPHGAIFGKQVLHTFSAFRPRSSVKTDMSPTKDLLAT